MKNKFILLIAVLGLSQSLNAQQNTNFVDDANVWYSYGGFYDALSGTQYVSQTHFYDGDTIINNMSYKKMFSLTLDTSKVWVSETEQVEIHNRTIRYEAAFRQQATSVYFVLSLDSNENLYIDFDMDIGDSIGLHYYYSSSSSTVSSIVPTPFGSTARKEFKLSNGISFYEGIGNGLGLFREFGGGVHGDIYLVCFQQDGIQQNVYQFSSPSPDCTPAITPTSIKEKQQYSDNFNIYPNPFTHSAHIDFFNATSEIYMLKMYNIHGQCVKTIDHFNQSNNVIKRDHLNAGIYSIEIISEENSQSYYGKVSIQ